MTSDTKLRDLENVFALRIADNHQFRSWLLSRTKFAKLWPLARLLDQASAQGEHSFWPRESAGIFLGFELEQTRLRFGVYVASALDESDLRNAESQRQRAADLMSQRERFLKLMDFETVLLAPQALILDDARTLSFDRRIPFETVAGFVPQFCDPVRIAA